MHRFALIAVSAVMLLVIILTWGSLGSAVMCFGLITMGISLLFQKFLTNRDDDYFQD